MSEASQVPSKERLCLHGMTLEDGCMHCRRVTVWVHEIERECHDPEHTEAMRHLAAIVDTEAERDRLRARCAELDRANTGLATESELRRAALGLRNTALRLIKAGPPLRMANDEVASWAAFIASEALSGEPDSVPETAEVPTGPIAGHAEHRFMLWLMKEIPPGTVISSPTWWSPRIFRAVQRAMEIHDSSEKANDTPSTSTGDPS